VQALAPSEDAKLSTNATEQSEAAHQRTSESGPGSNAARHLPTQSLKPPMCPASLTTHEATVAKSPPATAPPNGALQDATGGMLVPVLQVAGAARSSNASATGPVKKSWKMQVGKGQNGQYVVPSLCVAPIH
jgi:hypothetical protein